VQITDGFSVASVLTAHSLLRHCWPQNTDKIEFVATEHFWMSGMYWGLTAMHILGRLHEMDERAIIDWVLSCQHPNGGFGGSSRNDPHLLYTLSAVQILALFDKLHLVDAERIGKCKAMSVADEALDAAHAEVDFTSTIVGISPAITICRPGVPSAA
jgi:prenyltransferase beta subunit